MVCDLDPQYVVEPASLLNNVKLTQKSHMWHIVTCLCTSVFSMIAPYNSTERIIMNYKLAKFATGYAHV